MELGIIFSGEFGKRFVSNLVYPKSCRHFGACGIDECDFCKNYDLSDRVKWVIELNEPPSYGTYIEEPAEIIGKPEAEVIVALNLHPDILIELPEIAETTTIIISAESPSWITPGLREQIRQKCQGKGIDFYSPKPFCSSDTPLAELGFGKPEFRVEMNGSVIERVEVVKSDPCGNAHYVARRMEGYVITDVREFWRDIHQHQCAYPCLAGMERDVELKEAPFHLAGYVMVYQFSRACEIDAEGFVPDRMKKFVIE